MADNETKNVPEARCWAWTSLIIGVVVLLGAIATYAVPAVLVELGSVVGSILFLFGGERLRRTSVVILAVSTVFELVGGLVFLLLGFYLIAAPQTLGGFAVLIGFYALVFSVPIVAIGAIDLYTVYLVREYVFGNNSEEGAPLGERGVPTTVNMSLRP